MQAIFATPKALSGVHRSTNSGDPDTPKTLTRKSKDIDSTVTKLWTLVRFFTDKTLPDDFDLDQELSAKGINNNIVSNIVEYKHRKCYELVVSRADVNLVMTRFPDAEKLIDYDPFLPDKEDVLRYGLYKAQQLAQVKTLNNAVKAIRDGRGPGPGQCYREAVGRARLSEALERGLLIWDILQTADPQVLQLFTENLLFFSLYCLGRYDTPLAITLLERDQGDWLTPFRDIRTDLSFHQLKSAETQTTYLFRRFLEFSGGKVDCRQHVSEPDYTTSQNVSLCARLLNVPYSQQFGQFDPEAMQHALRRSKLHVGTVNVMSWCMNMIKSVPIGLARGHLSLPSYLLSHFGVGRIEQCHVYFEQMYCQFSSLRKPENNILLLLTFTSIQHGQTLRVLHEWVASGEGFRLHERLREEICIQATAEQIALTLAALLCLLRLLPHVPDETAQPIEGSYLADFDLILAGYTGRNRRAVYEHMILSLIRVLSTVGDESEKTVEFLAEVLDMKPVLLQPLDGLTDQYWKRRVDENKRKHREAFLEARDGVLRSVDATIRCGWQLGDRP